MNDLRKERFKIDHGRRHEAFSGKGRNEFGPSKNTPPADWEQIRRNGEAVWKSAVYLTIPECPHIAKLSQVVTSATPITPPPPRIEDLSIE